MISKERRQAIEDTLARSSMPEYLTIEADDGETLCVLTKHQLRTLLDHADEAEGLLRECREPVHKHGWCLHHQADHLCEPYGHVRGDQLWGLVSDIDKHLGEWDD